MRIVETYSHFGGEEIMMVRHRKLWDELIQVVERIDAAELRTKVSREQRRLGRMLYSPVDLNKAFRSSLAALGWHEQYPQYWGFDRPEPSESTDESGRQTQELDAGIAPNLPTHHYYLTDFVKDRVALEVQFGNYSFVALDILVKHLGLYSDNVIDVAIEMVPMKEMEAEMSPGVPYYERVLFNLLQLGRGRPSVPLVLIGIAP